MTSSYSEWFEKKRKRLQQDAEKKKRDELISSLSPDNILSEREAFFAKRRGSLDFPAFLFIFSIPFFVYCVAKFA